LSILFVDSSTTDESLVLSICTVIVLQSPLDTSVCSTISWVFFKSGPPPAIWFVPFAAQDPVLVSSNATQKYGKLSDGPEPMFVKLDTFGLIV